MQRVEPSTLLFLKILNFYVYKYDKWCIIVNVEIKQEESKYADFYHADEV